MSQLKPVTFSYKGKDCTVDSDDGIWGLIEAVEDVITFLELLPLVQSGKYPTARIFRAYAAALSYAGCRTTAQEVRAESTYADMGTMAGTLITIMMMAQPPIDVDLGKPSSDSEAESEKKKEAEAK